MRPAIFLVTVAVIITAMVGTIGYLTYQEPKKLSDQVASKQLQAIQQQQKELLAAMQKLSASKDQRLVETMTMTYSSTQEELQCGYLEQVAALDAIVAKTAYRLTRAGRDQEALNQVTTISDQQFKGHLLAYHIVPALQSRDALLTAAAIGEALQEKANRIEVLCTVALGLASINEMGQAIEPLRKAGQYSAELRQDAKLDPPKLEETPKDQFPTLPYRPNDTPVPPAPITPEPTPTEPDTGFLQEETDTKADTGLGWQARVAAWCLSALTALVVLAIKPGFEAHAKLWCRHTNFKKWKYPADQFDKALGI